MVSLSVQPVSVELLHPGGPQTMLLERDALASEATGSRRWIWFQP